MVEQNEQILVKPRMWIICTVFAFVIIIGILNVWRFNWNITVENMLLSEFGMFLVMVIGVSPEMFRTIIISETEITIRYYGVIKRRISLDRVCRIEVVPTHWSKVFMIEIDDCPPAGKEHIEFERMFHPFRMIGIVVLSDSDEVRYKEVLQQYFNDGGGTIYNTL